MSPGVWLKLGAITLALAVVLHVAAVWLVPFAIMRIFMARVTEQSGVNRVIAQRLPTDKSRSVVKPSPDLLYGLCVYDVGTGPVKVSIRPPATYWSLALFDTNTDNFFKLNANEITGGTAELILGIGTDRADAKLKFPSATFVATPHAKGVMLARILVLDQSNMGEAQAAQQSVQCAAIGNRG